jgi:opacity protein-like surface antigen
VQIAKTLVLVPAIVVAFATSALCQQEGRTAVSEPEQLGYVSAAVGVAFDPPKEPVISLEYGENIHRDVQAYATFSYFEDVMSARLQAELTATAQTVSSLSGYPIQLLGRDRALVFAVGGKYLVPTDLIRPYVGGGAGVLNIRRSIRDPQLGEATTAVLNDFGIGEVEFTGVSVTKPMVEAAFGVGVVAGHTYIDVGYRYRRAFHFTDELDLSHVSVGIGFKF